MKRAKEKKQILARKSSVMSKNDVAKRRIGYGVLALVMILGTAILSDAHIQNQELAVRQHANELVRIGVSEVDCSTAGCKMKTPTNVAGNPA